MPSGIYIRTAEHKRKISEANKGKLSPMKGKYLSKETKRKISLSHKGKHRSEETKRKIALARKGTHLTAKTRYKISFAHRGEKSSRWKGGISSLNQRIRRNIDSHLWREAVFARDNFTCQKCGKKGGDIQSHHIFNFATYLSLRFALDNGITLCNQCHLEFHKKYGIKNNIQEQLEEFLN